MFGRNFLDFLHCRKANVSLQRELLAYGPQLPDRYDPSDFSFKALVNTNWPMAVEYELEQQGTAVLTVKVMGAETFTQTLYGAGLGTPRTARFTLPAYPEKGPHPALITFKATRPGRFGDERAEFILRGAGAGEAAVASLVREPASVEVAALGPLPFEPPGRQFESRLRVYGVTLGPRWGGGYVFSFRVSGSFNRWRADIARRNRMKTRNESEKVVTLRLREESIGPRHPVSGDWNVLDGRERKVRPGTYSVHAMAWVSQTGDWGLRHGDSEAFTIN
jgi:hypothetical protein